MENIPRMRTLPEAVREIKSVDKNSAITITALRRMVDSGELPYIKVASKRLICLDVLIERLRGQSAEHSADMRLISRGGTQ